MQILTNLFDFNPRPHGTVVVIGNFDGVHLGHVDLLAQARRAADAHDLTLVVLTFSPHPRRFFRPDCPPFLLTRPDTQAQQLAAHGVDVLIRMLFDRDLSLMTADTFIRDVLRARLGAHAIVVGPDFHFGHDRAGSVETMRQAGLTVITPSLRVDETGQPISSSRIRGCLEQGHLDEASTMLGWRWFIRGTVVHGDARGRTLGYPTANIWLEETLAPAHGIYAGWVRPADATWPASKMAAIALGRRPMFEVPTALCEAHLLDFDGDLYDQVLDVTLVKRLRAEARFDSLEALITQMNRDCDTARTILTDDRCT